MTHTRETIAATLAATMLVSMLLVPTPASAWGRYGWGSGCGRHWAGWRPGWGYGATAGLLNAGATSYSYGYGYWGRAYPAGCGCYGSAYPAILPSDPD